MILRVIGKSKELAENRYVTEYRNSGSQFLTFFIDKSGDDQCASAFHVNGCFNPPGPQGGNNNSITNRNSILGIQSAYLRPNSRGNVSIRINGWPGMLERGVHELVVPDAQVAEQVAQLYEKLGWSFRVAPDIPGMITARILAVVINEAWYTWQEGVSSKEEIDTAMKLGTNYPMGPFEWGARIGLDRVIELLDVLSETDPRYIPAKSLKKAGSGIKI